MKAGWYLVGFKMIKVLWYLIDRLSHVIFLHGDVVAYQLLHGATQDTVFQQLLHTLLVL